MVQGDGFQTGGSSKKRKWGDSKGRALYPPPYMSVYMYVEFNVRVWLEK